MRFFGTSGIRRLADGYLLDLALKAGLAAGKKYRNVVVGRDTRTTGPAIQNALTAGLIAGGARVFDAGVLPTPTLAYAGRNYDGAVMLTASHNPPEYNGIKMLNPDGSAFSPQQQLEIEALMSADSLETVPWHEYKPGEKLSGVIEGHIEHIRHSFPGQYPVRVVLDCGGGAASVITPRLLEAMGCEVVAINSFPTGFFPRVSEPVRENLGELMQRVVSCGAQLGLAHDGDADRVMAVDDKGRFISGDKLLCILAGYLGAQHIVTTVDASMAIDASGFQSVERTPVGDNCVSEALKVGGDFGGEPSGAWIFPDNSLCPDGIYGAALLVSMAAGARLSDMVDAIPSYAICRGVVNYGGTVPQVLEDRLTAAFHPLVVSRIDGLKLNMPDAWLLLRPSGTEPRIRLTVESRSQQHMQQIYDRAMEIIRECLQLCRQ
jgi:phosphoglucosamine mutase